MTSAVHNDIASTLEGPRPRRLDVAVGAWLRRRALRLGVLGYLGLLVGLPVGYLFYSTFSSGFGAFWREVSQPAAVSAFELSGQIALVVVPLNTVVGIGAGMLLARRRFAGRRALGLTFDVPIAISPVIIGLALILAYAPLGSWFGPWLTRQGIMAIFSPLGIALATSAVTLPYVLRSVVPVLVEVGETQEVAARTLGAGPWRRLFGIAAAGAAEPELRLGDPLTVAHLRALLWIHRHREDLAARRAAVQAGRRRSDAEIFAKFPLRIVPTYPGDAQFDGAYFRTLLGRSPELVRSSLAEIFR